VDDPHAQSGTSVLKIEGGGTPNRPNAVDIPGTTNLGTTFTLSAMVKMTNKALTRIFSSYRGEDDLGSYEVLFDVDPSGSAFGSAFPIVRAVIHGTWVTSPPGRVTIVRDKYHHFAMTYDDGDVTLYFDAQKVGSGRVVPGGPVFSYYDLRVGHDWGGKSSYQQLVGYVDEILILPQALEHTDIGVLARQGAEQYLAGVELAKIRQLST